MKGEGSGGQAREVGEKGREVGIGYPLSTLSLNISQKYYKYCILMC